MSTKAKPAAEPAVTMFGTEASRALNGATLWWATFGDRTAEIAHDHGSRVLHVREMRDEAPWIETAGLDFGAALGAARRLVTKPAPRAKGGAR